MNTLVHLLNTHTGDIAVEPNRYGIGDWHGSCVWSRRFVSQWVNGGVYDAHYYSHGLPLACYESSLQ